MEALQTLILNKRIVTDQLAFAVYEQKQKADLVRLRSRATGKHRFTEQEFKSLKKVFTKLAEQLQKKAESIKQYNANATKGKKQPPLLHLMASPLLHTKYFLVETSEQDAAYQRLYHQLEKKTTWSDAELAHFAQRFEQFAQQILQTVEVSQKEAKQYPFSYGRGKYSHLLDNA